MPSPISAHSGQYHLYCCLQLHAISFLCPQWPVSTLLLPTATCLLLPLPTVATIISTVACSHMLTLSLPTVASITTTVAYNYMPTPFSAHSDQYQLYCCLHLHAFSSHCLQWPVSPLPFPTATFLLFHLCTVATITSTVACSYMPSFPILAATNISFPLNKATCHLLSELPVSLHSNAYSSIYYSLNMPGYKIN